MELRAIKSYYDNRLGLVTLEDDVLSIVSQVRQLFGEKVRVFLDPLTGWYLFVERCADGLDRLIFAAPELDQRCVERLLKGDQQSRGYEDPFDFAEKEQDRMQQVADDRARESIRQEAERLIWAVKADGLDDRLPAQIPVVRPKRHRRRRNAGHKR